MFRFRAIWKICHCLNVNVHDSFFLLCLKKQSLKASPKYLWWMEFRYERKIGKYVDRQKDWQDSVKGNVLKSDKNENLIGMLDNDAKLEEKFWKVQINKTVKNLLDFSYPGFILSLDNLDDFKNKTLIRFETSRSMYHVILFLNYFHSNKVFIHSFQLVSTRCSTFCFVH